MTYDKNSPTHTYDANDEGHADTRDMQASIGEVLQSEYEDLHVIPVKVCEPVETRELPARRTSFRSVFVNTLVGTQLLSQDRRRKVAIITSITNSVRYGESQSASVLTGMIMPPSLQIRFGSAGELWGCGTVNNTEVSIIEEYWA
jgi:hypothetical protein